MTPVRLDRTSWAATARPPRIVHIGVGSFSRAHQAWYTAHADPAGEWGIVAFTGRNPAVAEVLSHQDGLYTLIERGPREDRLEVIDSICDARPGSDVDGLITVIAARQTALVTLTVTEAGYVLGAAGDAIPSVPMRLALALASRRDAGAGPLAIVSCDNVHANGTKLRELTLAAAEEIGRGVRVWIEDEVSFVSTSVDRITPRTTAEDRLLVQREIDRTDDAPVVCEPFTDWVLCGEFPAGRPRWEDAGARFVADVEPWELRKLWLLNGGHSLLAYLGLLRGHVSVDDAAGDPEVDAALDRFWELAQRYLPVGDLDLHTYRRDLKQRFANGRIGYALAQIAGDGVAKLRNRVVPVVQAAIAAGDSAEPALRVIAAWAQWIGGVTDVAAVDASAGDLTPILACTAGVDRTRALMELLAPGWAARDELVEATERLRIDLTRTARGRRRPSIEVHTT
jgi:fructuronate reductase